MYTYPISGGLWGKCPLLWGTIPRFFHPTPFFHERRRPHDPHDRSVQSQHRRQGRLFIPASFRKALGQTFHVTVGQDHCLAVYSDDRWNEYMDKLKDMSYSEVKELRALFAYAADCEPDSQGRILIPAKLRDYAGLTKEVVVVGSFDRAEIWNAGRWAAVEAEAFSSGALEQAMARIGM